MDDWTARMRARLEPAYLSSSEPWKQSGFSGPEARWVALRKPIADCVDRSGSFLDIGCANGYLLECLRGWCDFSLELHGVDVSEKLIELARARVPDGEFTVADALSWTPPRRLDFVRTELVYVPADREAEYLRRLLREFVAPGGAVLVANYLEGADDVRERILPGAHPTIDLLARLAELGFSPSGVRDGFDVVKGRRTRVAILRGG
jgi:SAM-dependent methyltransferase